jgi:hypothetical protein
MIGPGFGSQQQMAGSGRASSSQVRPEAGDPPPADRGD